MANRGYGLSGATMYPPRGVYQGPRSNLARARRLVKAERFGRSGEGPFGMWSSRQINTATQRWPAGQAEKFGGRSVPEVSRDRFLNTLRAARGAGPIAPAYKPTLGMRIMDWGRGVTRRQNERYGRYY